MSQNPAFSKPALRLVEPVNVPAVPTGSDITFLASILDSSQDCIKVIAVDGTLNYMNRNGMCAMEIDDFTMVGGQKWHDLWPESARSEITDAIAAAAAGKAARFEAFCPTAKGTPRWWEVSVSPMKNGDAPVEFMVSVSRDITERVQQINRLKMHEMELQTLIIEQAEAMQDQKADLDSKDVMLREVDHRMKNSLSMLNSLLRMEGRNTESAEAKAKIANASSRVASIAKAHEQLFYVGDDAENDGTICMDQYLASLCSELQGTMDETAMEITVDADKDQMESANAVTLGLVTAEMVMNAARHAATDSGCAIEVRYTKTDEGRALEVSDNGCGLPDGFEPSSSSGLGMRVITSSATKLDGKLTFGNRERGSFFRLSF